MKLWLSLFKHSFKQIRFSFFYGPYAWAKTTQQRCRLSRLSFPKNMSFSTTTAHMPNLALFGCWTIAKLRGNGSFNATSHYQCHHCQRRSCWAGWGPPLLLLHSLWQALSTPWCAATAVFFLGNGKPSTVSDLMVRRFPYCVWPVFGHTNVYGSCLAIASRFERIVFVSAICTVYS